MSRDRSALGMPLGADGPWLAAILGVLDDIYDLLDKRLPGGTVADERGPNEILIGTGETIAAPPQPMKVSEPAPDQPPTITESRAAPLDDNPDRPLGDPPARAGRGASANAWRDWATRAGVTVPNDSSRADIIAACEQAGVIDKEQ